MPTMRPTLAPNLITERDLEAEKGLLAMIPLFFDDTSAVMYKKIDTAPLSATLPRYQRGSGDAAGIISGSWGTTLESDRGSVVSSLIPSRMTHRPLFALAGALSRE